MQGRGRHFAEKLRGAQQQGARRWVDASDNGKCHRPCSRMSQLGISGRPASTHLLFSSFNDCAPVLHIAHKTFWCYCWCSVTAIAAE